MRQAGIIAAGGIFALRHHVNRLAEDHVHARRLAEGLCRLPGVVLDPKSVETNIVLFELNGTLDATTQRGWCRHFFRAACGWARWDRGPSGPSAR